jgi:hypothetical protein
MGNEIETPNRSRKEFLMSSQTILFLYFSVLPFAAAAVSDLA